MIINKFFIFCGLMFVLPVIYAAEFQIADTKIILPQIKGYKIGNKDVLQTITKVQTQATKIFAVYLTDLDIAAGDDWIGEKYIAFGAQKLWLRKFQIHHFQQMKQTIQTQFKTFEKRLLEKLAKEEKQVSNKLTTDDCKVLLKTNAVVLHSTFSLHKNSISTIILASSTHEVNNKKEQKVTISNNNIVFLNDAIFYFYIESPYKTDADIANSKSLASQVLTELFRCNKVLNGNLE